MAQLILRKLDPQIKLRLKLLAKSKGLSMEAVARSIITESVESIDTKTGQKLAAYFSDIDFVFDPEPMSEEPLQNKELFS